MGPTNASIILSRREIIKAVGQPQRVKTTELGNFDVWVDEKFDVDRVSSDLGITPERAEVGKGLVIMWDEIDLSNCFIQYGSMVYEVMHVSVFRDSDRVFHHSEFIYA